MLWPLCFTTVLVTVTVLLPFIVTTNIKSGALTNEAIHWIEMTASRIFTCEYPDTSGLWKNEQRWQSGNTLETLANFISVLYSPLKSVFHQIFMNTPTFVPGDCFDDYLWWLTAWLQVYSVEPDLNYLYRAADMFDYVAVNGWNASVCNGGVQLCSNNTYKSAIANELFLLSSMRLHPYAALLDRPPTFYLDWALKEWQWFQASGLINGNNLINDGLRYGFSEKRIIVTL
jgi:hypothetical protein